MTKQRRCGKYNFDVMEVGSALEFDSPRVAHSAFCAAKYFAETYQPEWRFKVKSELVGMRGKKIHRLWRIA